MGHPEWFIPEDYQNCLNVNLFGHINVTRIFLPLLKKSKGRIINTTSILGRIGQPVFTPYVVSKYAAEGFSECLRYVWLLPSGPVLQRSHETQKKRNMFHLVVVQCYIFWFHTLSSSALKRHITHIVINKGLSATLIMCNCKSLQLFLSCVRENRIKEFMCIELVIVK